jgi:hypothetical protein
MATTSTIQSEGLTIPRSQLLWDSIKAVSTSDTLQHPDAVVLPPRFRALSYSTPMLW